MKRLTAWVCGFVVVALLGGLSGCAGEGDGTIQLRVATGLSAQHAWWVSTMVPWMDRVDELTEGQVRFTSFTGGELVDVPHEIDALRNGTIHIAPILPMYLPGEFPLTEVTMLPVSRSDAVIASRAWRDLLESDRVLWNGQTYFESQFEAQGLTGFPIATTEAYTISTTGVELDSVERIRGLSLRTPARVPAMYAEQVGFNSVTIPAVEMYDALSRGTFDGSFYSVADWSGYGFQDLFRYTLTDINFGHFNGLIAMTTSTWDSLPEDVQAAMLQAHDEVYLEGAQAWADRAEEMVEYNTGIGGVFRSFNDLDPAVQQRLLEGIEATWHEYIALLERDGFPGRELALLWRDLLVANGGEVPDAIAALD